MIKKTIKYLSLVFLLYCLFCLTTPFNKLLRKRSIQNQINYLSEILDQGYDDQLQSRFPEGKLFSNSLLALATIEYCEKYEVPDQKYAEIVDKCVVRIQSKKALETFDPNMQPAYGMFYNGWSNYVYSQYIKSKLFNYSNIKENVVNASELIENRLASIQTDSIRILDTYYDANWPADNMIGILSLNDEDLKNNWTKKILETTKHESGLIHHSGYDVSEIRGASGAMISFYLNKSEFQNASAYNKKFKDTFVDNFLGILLVKENEDGSDLTDVDSGPVLFGYGASATIMNIKTQASFGSSKSRITWAAMNLIAFPVNILGQKYYLMKKEPMLDLFMLWASTEL